MKQICLFFSLGKRTGSDECFGGRLAHEVREREWGTDAFESAEVPEYHRGLAWPEAEYGLISLPPLFVEKARAGLRVWAGRTLFVASDVLKKMIIIAPGKERNVRIRILWRSARGRV